MNPGMYEDLAVEEIIRNQFGLEITLHKTLLSNIPVSHTMEATVFLNDKSQLYVFINGRSRLKFGDVKKIITRMGLKAEQYIPPHKDEKYFENIAMHHFKSTFPGRSTVSDADLGYYKTLAPYMPALVKVSEVSKGLIYQFDTDSPSLWRPALQYSYRKISTI